jgi:hypothetical protein
MTLPPMAAESLTERLRSYYTRYYRDTLLGVVISR